MRRFNVKFQRVECYVENMEIEAESAEAARRMAEELLDDEEVSFDGEVCHGEESVLEIVELGGEPA